jgi:Zn-dependent protease/predicted transcriptional regulator
MNGKGFTIGRVHGIPISVDASWLIIFFLIWMFFWTDLATEVRDGMVASQVGVWVGAFIGTVLFFGSVLIHELSHSLVAVGRGIPVKQIRLFVFGGVSEIEEEATTPGAEFAITIAGPLASVLLGAAFYGLSFPFGRSTLVGHLSTQLGVINVILGVFNLAPGFPLDGGRVLRSIVWKITGDFDKATRVAVMGGRGVAITMVVVGVIMLLTRGNLGGLWWIVLGWFLFQAAGSAQFQMETKRLLRGITAGQIMTPTPVAVESDLTLQDLFDHYFMQHNYSCFPVVEDGSVRGIVSMRQLREVDRERWATTRTAEVMRELEPEDAVAADADVESLIPRLAGEGRRVVVVSEGHLVGIISSSDVARWIQHHRV